MVVRDLFFEIKTPLGVKIRTTREYWKIITTIKHPSVAKHTKNVKNSLSNPDEVRQSKQDPRVHLYYRKIGKLHICVVADHVGENEGYIITAYLTDRIKEGEKIYVKSKNIL